jgi:uncharacterized phage protein (TIGR01671 family)
MQRELRFRTWFQDQMTYLEQSIGKYDYENGIVLSFSDEGYDEFGAHERFDVSQSNPPPMMQWTGLRDKNGKEIYEGDICKCHDHPTGIEDTIGEVIFDQGRYWIATGSICSLDDYGTAWTEVLGNIYETPELIPRAVGG